MLICQMGRLILFLKFLLIHGLENVFKAPVILLEDGVLGRVINRQPARESIREAGASKAANGFIQVVHGEPYARPMESEHLIVGRRGAALGCEGQCQFAWLVHNQIGGAVLIPKRMATHYDRLDPAWYIARHIAAD